MLRNTSCGGNGGENTPHLAIYDPSEILSFLSSKERENRFSIDAMGKKELAKRGADARHVADVQGDSANPSAFQRGDDGGLCLLLFQGKRIENLYILLYGWFLALFFL